MTSGGKSGCWTVASGVLQKSVLQPIHLNIFINNLDGGTECVVSEVATPHSGKSTYLLEGRAAIEKDLDRCKKWANRNLRKFNKSKCKNLPLGRNKHMY